MLSAHASLQGRAKSGREDPVRIYSIDCQHYSRRGPCQHRPAVTLLARSDEVPEELKPHEAVVCGPTDPDAASASPAMEMLVAIGPSVPARERLRRAQ
jgi:hypothetical protein